MLVRHGSSLRLPMNLLIILANYKIFRCDKGRGGGVCIYVKNYLNVTHIQRSKLPCKPVEIEDVWLNVQCRKLPSIVIGCLYRHPKAPAQTFDGIRDVFKTMWLTKKNFYVLGDFNDNLLCDGSNLKKILATTKLSQVIQKPTRITSHCATLLDVIVTNKCESILHSDVVPCPIADHDLVTPTINICKPKRLPAITKTTRHMADYSPVIFCHMLWGERFELQQLF